jgi:hypothetical protein
MSEPVKVWCITSDGEPLIWTIEETAKRARDKMVWRGGNDWEDFYRNGYRCQPFTLVPGHSDHDAPIKDLVPTHLIEAFFEDDDRKATADE